MDEIDSPNPFAPPNAEQAEPEQDSSHWHPPVLAACLFFLGYSSSLHQPLVIDFWGFLYSFVLGGLWWFVLCILSSTRTILREPTGPRRLLSGFLIVCSLFQLVTRVSQLLQ